MKFNPNYKEGDRIRYKRELTDSDSEISNEIYIIKGVHHDKNNYFYYETELLYGKLVSPFIDCELLEKNTEMI